MSTESPSSSKPSPPTESAWSLPTVVHWILFVGLLVLLGVSLAHREYAEKMFIHATYYFLLVLVVAWIGTYLHVARDVRRPAVVEWIKDNKAGLLVALLVTLVSALAIHPALRVLSDEANLLGTSKNLFYSKTATFTTTGKYYYDNFWDAGVVIDRRPSLFPFLVSLVHVLRGYSYTNVFLFNLLVMPAFVLVSYRLAKVAANETVGVVAALLVAAHPITLISMRSGGFDFLAAFFSVLIIKSFLDHSRKPSAGTLAILWMNLCMFAEIRYETGLFLPPVVAVLLLFGLVKQSYIRPYRLLYALTPAFLLPRVWQAILRGNVPEQDAGAIVFSFGHFLENARDYFKPILSPFEFHPPHSAIVIGVGVAGSLLWLRWLDARIRARDWKAPKFQFGTLVAVWMVVQLVIVFSYVWGRAQHPAASRLVIAIDTFFAFPAAWLLTVALQRFRPFVVMSIAAALFAIYVPVASEYRILNELTLTREAATTWRFFENLHENRIMVITDRPGLYTIMNYGATDFESAKADPSLLPSLDRRLFFEMYLVQQIDLTTHNPIPGHEIWPERPRSTMIEFQNDANATVRISRLAH
jgi:hypothetical protein